MKVILDTNVLISAFVFKGFSAKVFDYCVLQEEIMLSPWIIDELKEKLQGKFKIDEETIIEIMSLLTEKSQIIQPTNAIPTVCRDADDNNILQLAEFTSVDFIITGDKDLLHCELSYFIFLVMGLNRTIAFI